MADKVDMTNALPDRIRSRLDALGKSAAGASLEAGLGRSAIQDILKGHSSSPRLKTLIRLAVVLECSTAYLMGAAEEVGSVAMEQALSDNPYLDLKEVEAVTELEANVFRASTKTTFLGRRKYGSFRDYRYLKSIHREYVMADNSMEGSGISRGDFVTAIEPDDEIILKHGMIVVVSRLLEGAGKGVSEFSLRRVHVDKGQVRLVLHPSVEGAGYTDPLTIEMSDRYDETSGFMVNNYFIEGGGIVSIEGLAVRTMRVLAIPD